MGASKKYDFGRILMDAPEKAKAEDLVLSIYKNGQMLISKAAVFEFGFEGMFVDIVWDEYKRAFGFKKMNGEILPSNEWTKTMRLLNNKNSNGSIKVSIGRIMSKIGLEHVDFKSLPIKTYNDQLEGRMIYFVELPRDK